METSVYIFMILLDVYIAFIIFAIYFYVLFKYYLHIFEENGIVNQVLTHLEFYKPIVTLIKEYSQLDKNIIPKLIKDTIDNTFNKPHTNTFSIGKVLIIGSTLSFLLILLIYFVICYEKIIEHIKIENLILTIFLNIILIVGFELMFIFFVYGSLDIVNIQALIGI